jgi:hypothetical protein
MEQNRRGFSTQAGSLWNLGELLGERNKELFGGTTESDLTDDSR